MATTSPSEPSEPAVEVGQEENQNVSSIDDQQPIHVILSKNYAANREKGWRAKDFGVYRKIRSERFRKLLLLDYAELKGYLSARADNMHFQGCPRASGRFIPRDSDFNPKSIVYLCYAWGVGHNHPAMLLKRAKATKLPPKKPNPMNFSVIDSYEAAKIQFSPKSLFLQHRVEARTVLGQDKPLSKEALKEAKHVAREEAKAEWVLLSEAEKAEWSLKSQYYLERQPFMKDQILELIRADPSKSWEKLAEDIGHWCSKAAMRLWFYTLPDSITSIKPKIQRKPRSSK